MAAEKRPWLDYSGQSTAQILACKGTHRIDSLLCAIEEGILLLQSRKVKRGTTPAERTILAVMALDREVNNGGYHQFFVNSSHEYAPTIVTALRKVGCEFTAALTGKAIEALALDHLTIQAVHRAILTPDARRKRKLDSYDRQFYKPAEIEPRLFAFVEAQAHRIMLEPTTVPSRPKDRGFTSVSLLLTSLEFTPKTDHSFDGVRLLVAELAATKAPNAKPAEIDGAAYLYLFQSCLRVDDLSGCEAYAPYSFELAWEDTTHCVLHCKWVEKLIAAGRPARADAAALQYLRRLASDDTGSEFVMKRVRFWADLIHRQSSVLPESAQSLRSLLAGSNGTNE
jgi:hypothetical protein